MPAAAPVACSSLESISTVVRSTSGVISRHVIVWVIAIVGLVAPLTAQSQYVELRLDDGTVLVGRLEGMDEECIRLRLVDAEESVVTVHARRMTRLEPIAAETARFRPGRRVEEADERADSESIDSGEGDVEPGEPVDASPGLAAPLAETGPRPRPPSGVDDQLTHWFDRYLWMVPDSRGHRVTFGGLILFVLAGMIRLAIRIANLEARSFGRCVLLASVCFAVACLEISLVQSLDPGVLGWIALVGFDVALWFGVAIPALGIRPFEALVMLASVALSVLLAVLTLEVCAVALQTGRLA